VSTVLTAPAEITMFRLTQEVLSAQSLQSVWQLGTPVVHLDLSGLRFPTAEGLGALVVLNQELRARGGGLLLVHVPAAIQEVLRVTRLVEVLDVRTE
jgi:anti-anti-sigma factor